MSKVRVAAAVMLTRGPAERPEVYLVERSPKLRFFGGYWAMPGGVVDAGDEVQGASAVDTLRRCAARELFEETGVLLAGGSMDATTRTTLREKLFDGKPDGWQRWLERHDDALDRVQPLCEITTPEFAPVRYKTQFLHVALPDGEEPSVLPGELEQGRWFAPGDLLDRWQRGELLVVPPVLFLLRRWIGRDWSGFREVVDADVRELGQGRLHEVYFSPGIFLAPLRTPTIPPATTTNCVLIGEDRVYIIDPATPHADEQERLFRALARWQSEGRQLEAVVATHHHEDHIGAVEATAQRFDLPVRAHARTLERLTGEFHRGAPIEDGDVLPLGRSPDGQEGWTLTAHHTPGHDQGHLVFQESRYGALVAGDLVSTLSTILIDPPEGHLATYLNSLRRALELQPTTIYPAHGPAHRDGVAMLRHYLSHRQKREDRLVEVLARNPSNESTLVAEVYDDTDPKMWPLATRSLRAGLEKLEEEGRTRRDGSTWTLVDATPSGG